MATKFKLPKDSELKEMLSMLYDGLEIKPGTTVSTDKGSKVMIAVFVDDQDQPVTACVGDYNFTAFAGAALTRIPKGGAEDAASSGDFSEMLLGNFYEVMNICSRLFMDSSTPHLKLEKSYKSIDELPDNVSSMIAATTGQTGFDITIQNYGAGKLSFLAT